MPRITADTVAEHARLQRVAVLDAAARLFTTLGVDKVSVGDIAAEVGLARNSIYRYFPDRNHMLVAWFDQEIEGLAVACDQIIESERSPQEQLASWVKVHFEYLQLPGHLEMIAAVTSATDLPESTYEHIAEGHERIYKPLRVILSGLRPDLNADSADLALLATLVTAMVQACARATPGEPTRAERNSRSLIAAIRGAVAGFRPD